MESLHQYLRTAESEIFQLLERLVLQSSHSDHKEGVDRVGRQIQEALADCHLRLSVDPVQSYGNNLVFASPACSPTQPHILLVGHMDTVFPLESSFDYYKEDSRHAYGPGVCDMKGGLVTAVYLIKALAAAGLLDSIPVVLICNSDEEVGSPLSTGLIKRYAAGSLCGLVFECGGTGGEVVTGRKGKSGYRLDIHGRSGHAAFAGAGGKASAVLELAHKIIEVEGLNDAARGIVVNVGRVEGGVAANVVAERACAEIDTRYVSDADGEYLRLSINEIAAGAAIGTTTSTVRPTNSRTPMMQTPANTALYQLFKEQADALGLELRCECRSGVSDANTLAECGIPVIDGLGPVGDLDHSPDEYIVKESLVQRCLLSACTVVEIWRRRRAGSL